MSTNSNILEFQQYMYIWTHNYEKYIQISANMHTIVLIIHKIIFDNFRILERNKHPKLLVKNTFDWSIQLALKTNCISNIDNLFSK